MFNLLIVYQSLEINLPDINNVVYVGKKNIDIYYVHKQKKFYFG